MPACVTFYDLFAGDCSVGHMMGYFGKCEKVVFNDVNAMPLELFHMALERLSRFDELPINLPIEFRNCDYRAAAEDAGEDDVIYADPPYAVKAGYGVAFDNEEFWEWCRQPRRALLIVSEYSAPPDFAEVWAKKTTCSMSQNGEVGRPIERLFVHKSQVGRYWFEFGMPTLPLQFD